MVGRSGALLSELDDYVCTFFSTCSESSFEAEGCYVLGHNQYGPSVQEL